MKHIVAAAALLCSLVGSSGAQAQTGGADAAAEAVNVVAGQQYYGWVGDFRHIWVFKKDGTALALNYYSGGGKPEFAGASDPLPGMSRSRDIAVQVSKVGSTYHLEFTYSGSVTTNGVTRQADSRYHADVVGNTITGSAGPPGDDRRWRISLTRKPS